MNYFRDCTSDESSCNIHYILFVYSRQCVSTNGYRCVLNKQKILGCFWKWYIIVGNAFLVQQRNSKCISNTKKFVNDNLSSTNGYQNRISHFHCNLQVEIAAYFFLCLSVVSIASFKIIRNNYFCRIIGGLRCTMLQKNLIS